MEETEKKIEDRFVNLHLHSTYSFTDGYGLPEQYVARCKEIGQPAMGVTDHGNVSAHYKWYKQCNKEGIKPILGCEMYLVETADDIRERDYNHITVLVQNNVGYRNLMKLVTISYNQIYYKPRITFEQLFDHQEGLIVLSGCLSSPVMQALKEGKKEHAKNLLRRFRNKIKNFYIEIMPIHFKDGEKPYADLIDLYHELKFEGFEWVATNDCHYVCKEHHKVQEVLLCVQSNDTMKNPKHWCFDQDDFYLKTRAEMKETLLKAFPYYFEEEFEKALDNTLKIADMVDFTFPTAEPLKFDIPEDQKFGVLQEQCYNALEKIGKFDDKIYKDRLDYELDLVKQKNFLDYFLVISDLVNWAKNNDILVGPARGSAAGSLACFLLRITEVDPMIHDLLFERFIDINREDLPDIDIDFEDLRRHEIKEYLADKYGHDKVGNLPVFAAFKGKSALADIGRVFKIPFQVVDEVKQAVVERSGGDSRASFTLEDTFKSEVFTKPKEHIEKYPEFKYAIDLEGQYRQIGQHAAGLIISNEPLTNFCAIYRIRGEPVISLDYKDASSIGLLKIDLLGLSTLSVVSRALKEVKERHGVDIDPYTMPLDDPETYKGFIKEQLFGIFQFDGQAVNQVCRQIKPRDFESLSAISALARPGPLNGGSTTAYIQRRAGKEQVHYVHKVMEPYTKDTYGVVVYQEQVMKTMREVGKMSWKDTSEIRRLISRSLGEEYFNQFKERFTVGAKENGLDDKQIDDIWNSVCTFGSWAFNKSHSVSYTIISYWTMWLKVHYPIEFYASILFLEDDDGKRKKILKEYKKEGYKVLQIDVNKSKEHFTIEDQGLRIGFGDIKGVGPMIAKQYVKNQPYKSFLDCQKKLKKKDGDRTMQLLADLGAFDSLASEDLQYDIFGEQVLPYVKRTMSFEEKFSVCPWDMEFGIEKQWRPYIDKNPQLFPTEITPIENLAHITDGFSGNDTVIMGIVYDKNLRDAREVSASKGKAMDLRKYNAAKLLIKDPWFKNKYVSTKTIENYERVTGKKLEMFKDYVMEPLYQFANFVIEDDTNFITVRLSHLMFPEYGNLIMEQIKADDVVIIKGKMGSGIRMFFANKVACLRHLRDGIKCETTSPVNLGTGSMTAGNAGGAKGTPTTVSTTSSDVEQLTLL